MNHSSGRMRSSSVSLRFTRLFRVRVRGLEWVRCSYGSEVATFVVLGGRVILSTLSTPHTEMNGEKLQEVISSTRSLELAVSSISRMSALLEENLSSSPSGTFDTSLLDELDLDLPGDDPEPAFGQHLP